MKIDGAKASYSEGESHLRVNVNALPSTNHKPRPAVEPLKTQAFGEGRYQQGRAGSCLISIPWSNGLKVQDYNSKLVRFGLENSILGYAIGHYFINVQLLGI